MAGLNGLVGALTAAAGVGKGLMQGQEEVRQQKLRDEDRAFQMEGRDRQRQQWGREDAVSAALERADEAGRTAYLSALDGQQAQPEQRQGAVDNYLTNGGSDGSMPDQSKLDGFDPATAPVTQQAKPAQPAMGDRSALLAGMTARARALAEASKAAPGVSAEWLKTHNDAAALRGQMRLEALDQAEARFRATGDPSHMKAAYNLLDDGYTTTDIVRTPDGKIRITRVNDKTGQTDTRDATEEQFQAGINFLRDPKATRQQEAKAALQDELQQWMLKRIAQQGLNQATVQDKKNDGATKVQGLKNDGKLDQIDAKGDIDERIARLKADASLKEAGIRVQGSMTLAQFRAAHRGGGSGGGLSGANLFKTETQADGSILAIRRDGSSYVLTDDNGNPRVSTKAVDQAMKIDQQVGSDMSALGKKPEEVKQMAVEKRKEIVGSVTPKPIAPRAGSGAKVNGRPIESFWGDK